MNRQQRRLIDKAAQRKLAGEPTRGELKLHHGYDHHGVFIQMSMKVDNLTFTPEQARAFIEAFEKTVRLYEQAVAARNQEGLQ
ncbi:MAG TPA: hypothetical protein VMU55_06510 [Solirubrobacteraceae bacterium]|nr:hypothetical protein [Solirubrobacteraceae bacterium]